jgi:cytochrome bd-type quinol oxidase subunit 2
VCAFCRAPLLLLRPRLPQPPLVLSLLHPVLSVPSPLPAVALFAALDVVAALLLRQIAADYRTRRPDTVLSPTTVMLMCAMDAPSVAVGGGLTKLVRTRSYLLNPYSVAACVGQSTALLVHVAVLLALHAAQTGARRVGARACGCIAVSG